MNTDVGLTHIAIAVTNIDNSMKFYAKYAKMIIVHERIDKETNSRVVWISDKTRPFVIVLFQIEKIQVILEPLTHLGIGCASRSEVDQLCNEAKNEGVLVKEAVDSGYPIGYWALISDPDGHTLELSYGQEIGLTIENSAN